MGDILFLAHRVPFPPDRGDKIRSHHLLKGLAKLAPVHVGTFGESAQDMAQGPALAAVARSHTLIERTRPLPLAGLAALATGVPVSLTAFADAAMGRYVAETLAAHPIETIFVFSGQMGQYIPDSFQGRVIVDLCDVDSAKFEAYAAAGRRRWINGREARLLAREEERLAHRADVTLLISEAEAALLRERLHDPARADVRALGNGIDAELFDPAAVEPHPVLAATPGPQLVLTGQMDYAPNVEATVWFSERVLPELRKKHPGARFHVVGRAPSPAVRALHGAGGVHVWGEVPDVRPFLKGADCVVAPLMIARGVQNKVLEAMAMACPVILTPGAATGIAGRDGEYFAIAEAQPDTFAKRIEALLDDPARGQEMGQAARRFVVETMSWAQVDRALAKLLDRSQEARDAA